MAEYPDVDKLPRHLLPSSYPQRGGHEAPATPFALPRTTPQPGQGGERPPVQVRPYPIPDAEPTPRQAQAEQLELEAEHLAELADTLFGKLKLRRFTDETAVALVAAVLHGR